MGESLENFMQVSLFLIYTFSVCMDAQIFGTGSNKIIFWIKDSSYIEVSLLGYKISRYDQLELSSDL